MEKFKDSAAKQNKTKDQESKRNIMPIPPPKPSTKRLSNNKKKMHFIIVAQEGILQ